MQSWLGRGSKPDSIRVSFEIEESKIIHTWYSPNADSAWLRSKWHKFSEGIFGESLSMNDALEGREYKKPQQIFYRKNRGSKYHDVIAVIYSE